MTTIAYKPKLFIGSSTEALNVARAIEYQLCHDAEITIWNNGLFQLSKGNLENLLEFPKKFDFALFVVSVDDVVESRGDSFMAPRDNIMFELGLFIGKLGRDRVFIIADNDKVLKIPSDLAGISFATYHTGRLDGNLLSAVSPACTLIRDAIHSFLNEKEIIPEDNELDEILKDIEYGIKQSFSFDCKVFKNIIKKKLDLFFDDIGNWSNGQIYVGPRDSYGFLVDLYRTAKVSVFSTSIKAFSDNWSGDFGNELLKANIENKANVTRIFVFETRNEICEEDIIEMKKQHDLGINVYAYIDIEASFTLPSHIARDFTVIDEGNIIGLTETFGKNNNGARYYFKNKNMIRLFSSVTRTLLNVSYPFQYLNEWWKTKNT